MQNKTDSSGHHDLTMVPPPPDRRPAVMFLTFLALACAGLGFFCWQSYIQSHWTAVQAEVVKADVLSERVRSSESYGIWVTYRYSVGNVTYSCFDNVLGGGGSKAGAESEVDRHYRPGMKLTVYYNGSSPQESAVEPHYLGRAEIFLLLVLAGLALIPGWTLISQTLAYERQKRKLTHGAENF